MRTTQKQKLSLCLKKGFMLLETALALLIVSAVGTIALNAQLAELKDQKAVAQANALLQVQGGANSYVTTYRSSLVSGTPILGVASLYYPTIAELNALNVGLPKNFSNAALIGGTYQVHVTTSPSPCVQSNCHVEAISWITQPLNESDGTVDYPRLGLALRTMGIDGAISTNIDPSTGVVNAAAAGTIQGIGGHWNGQNPAGSVPGIIAARSGYASEFLNQFVRRDGQSQMTGNLQLGDGTTNNDIVNLKNLTADNQVASKTMKATTNITAGGTIAAAGTICSGNSALDCSGSGGTVIIGSTVNSSNINLTPGSFISNSGTQNIASGQLNLNPDGGAVVVGNSGATSVFEVAGISKFLSSTFFSAVQTIKANGWSVVALDGSGNSNANAKSSDGSIYANDIYVRSIGKWVSETALSLGEGQHWYDMTYARCANCSYTNTSGRAIMVNISLDSYSGGQIISHFYIDGVQVGEYNEYNNRYNNVGFFSAVVPNGSNYYLDFQGDNYYVGNWSEMR